MATTYLSKTFSSEGTRKKWTFSAWIKGIRVGAVNHIFSYYNNDSARWSTLQITGTYKLRYYDYNNGTFYTQLVSTKTMQDPNAWYHIVLTYDTAQSTAADRVKMYVNGEQLTALDTATYPNQNHSAYINNDTNPHTIGHEITGGYFEGCMTHIHFTDNYAYAASDFGSTDSVTGEWNINTTPSVSYGTNGFFILKDTNSVTDQSGQSNNWAVAAGSLTPTIDNPSNNFAVFNALFKAGAGTTTFSNGNLTGQSPNSQGSSGVSSLGAKSGKWYAEFKQSAESTTNEGAIAVVDSHYINQNLGLSSSGYLEYCVACWGLRDHSSGGTFYSSGGSRSTGSSQHQGWSNGDILMVAMDIDNNRVYFGKNGQWNASNTWSSATPSQYLTLDATDFEGEYHFAVGDSSSGNNVTWQANFGNGYFGSTAVTSAQNPDDGIGIFEYTVPTGYKALCTKGLNS